MLRADISRRYVLKLLAGGAVSLPIVGKLAFPAKNKAILTPTLLGTLTSTSAYQPKFFNRHQMLTLAELGETIIPSDEHSPGAKAARVEEYMDDIIADAATEQKDRDLWSHGLLAVDGLSQQKFQKEFRSLTPQQMQRVLAGIARNEEHPVSLEEHFFNAVKAATVDGYYNSAIGIHSEIGYRGNRAQLNFTGCTHSEHEKLSTSK